VYLRRSQPLKGVPHVDCFRTCDIRGKYPEEVNEGLYYHVGRRLAEKFLGGKPILIGSDLRLSSPALKQALTDGLTASGARVYDAGTVPTPVLHFGKRKLGVYATAMVTASHNPPDYNGLKILLGRFPAAAAQLRQLKPDGTAELPRHSSHSAEAVDLAQAFLEFLAAAWKNRLHSTPSKSSRTYVFDPGGGTWTLLIKEILQQLDIPGTVIHAEPDGRFLHRPPDCVAPESHQLLGAEVRRTGAAAGLAWDGDGDRLAVCDNKGRALLTDHLALLLLPEMIRGKQPEKVLFDVKISRCIPTAIGKLGAIALMERSAHCFLETRMIQEDCVFGFESSGHFFFRELAGGDDGMYAALVVVDFLERHPQCLSDLVEMLPKLHITPDLRIPGNEAEFVVIRSRVEEEFSSATISYLDGVRVELPRSWFIIRPSVSENKLSFRFEGDTAEELEALLDRVTRMLPEHSMALHRRLDQWHSVAHLA
jgi:phosphomannomutase